MTPSIGRIVHYVIQNGQHRAAVVVNYWPNDDQRANLTVFVDQMNDKEFAPNGNLAVGSAKQDEETKAPGTWHWPEREA